MRVLVYGINYSPEPTGIGRYTGAMARWLVQKGDEVVVITAPPHYPSWSLGISGIGNHYARTKDDGVIVLRAPIWIPRRRRDTLVRVGLETSFGVTSTRWWLAPLFRGGFDAILSVSPPTQMALWPLLHHAVRGTPWFLHVQDLQVDAALRLNLVRLPPPVAKFLFAVESSFLQRATHVSTISERMRNQIIAKGVPAKRTSIVPNWADLDLIRPCPANSTVRAALGAGPDDVLMVYSGNLGEKQGLGVLLEAAVRLSAQPGLRFAIVGDGLAANELRRRAQDLGVTNVAFHPLVPQSELADLLAAADVHLVIQRRAAADLVLPSKLANIAAAGKPSIVTADAATDLYRITRSARLGLVCPPEDPASLAAAIQRLAASPPLRRELGTNARSFAERSLGIDAALEPLRDRILASATRVRETPPAGDG